MSLYKYMSLSSQYVMVPIAIETLGAYGGEAWNFVDVLGDRVARATGDVRSKSFLRQRLSIAVQRGNAAAIQGTHRGDPPW